METKVFEDTIKSLNTGFSTTNQLYGLAYIIIDGSELLADFEELIVDEILKSVNIIEVDGRPISYIHEGPNENNYYTSHYANFVLNLMVYVCFKRLEKRSTYRLSEIINIKNQVADFLKHEKEYLVDDSIKTVGFELIVDRYINEVENFNDINFIDKYKHLAKARLKRFTPILAFTPEGIKGIYHKFLIKFLSNKLFPKVLNDTFIFDSPETTINLIRKLIKKSNAIFQDFRDYILVNKGLPAFFKSEFLDIFWITDILNTAGLLNEKLKVQLKDEISKSNYRNTNWEGTLNDRKGFSIAKGFMLYDSDTTAMAIKTFDILQIDEEKLKSFDFEYYKTDQPSTYFTYKYDNRPSISTLAHILNAQVVQENINSSLRSFLDECIEKKVFNDKWHVSKLYVLYSLGIAYSDLATTDLSAKKYLQKIVEEILSYEKTNHLFTSIQGIDSGTVEEASWALLTLNYIYKQHKEDYSFLKDTIPVVKQAITKNYKDINSLEKLWYVKCIYNLPKILTALVYAATNLNE